MGDEELRRLAEEMPCTCPTREDVHDPERYVNCARRRAFELLRRVAEEARRGAEAEVEALRAEVERLKSERDSADRGVARNAEKAAEMMRERDEARADRDRLREALKEVHEWVEGRDEAGCLAAVEIIERALASGEESR